MDYGKKTLFELGKKYRITRRALEEEFELFFNIKSPESVTSFNIKIRVLIVDGKYIHGNELCVLIGLANKNKIFFQFASEESYKTWLSFLSRFPEPEVIVSDGQKGLRYMVSLAIQYLSRNPKTQSGKEVLHLLYELKNVKTYEERDRWITLFKIWEKMLFLAAAKGDKEIKDYTYAKERSVNLIIKRALPNLFTYLDYPDVPNTTNLVECWINTAIAEGLREHRGIHLSQKKTLVSIILLNLSRNLKEKPTRKFT